MSQKINPNSLRLGIQRSWESVWFSDPNKQKQNYTKLLHEDLIIQNYLKGFFWMFDIYQSNCFIDRKPNGDIQIRVQVYKHQKGSNLGPKENNLKDGLNLGWVPFIVMKTIGTLNSQNRASFTKKDCFNYASNLTLLNIKLIHSLKETNLNYKNIWSFLKSWPISRLSKHSFKLNDKHGQIKSKMFHSNNLMSEGIAESLSTHSKTNSGPSKHSTDTILNSILTNQDVDKEKFNTEVIRFNKDWKAFLNHKTDKEVMFSEIISNNTSSNEKSNDDNWWFKRQWESRIQTISGNSKKLSFVIEPVQTMVEDPKLIADYIATKIEISTPIQTVFNEIIRIFEQEVQCIGPDFEIGSNVKHLESESKDGYGITSPQSNIIIEGFKLECSGRIQVYPRSKPAEKAESIQISRGNLPLNTLYENIQFAQTHATNDYGTCGIKVWVNYASK